MFFLTLFILCAAISGRCAGDPTARLVGGEEAEDPSLFSHHVMISSLRMGRKCGGSILNEHWVLTSSACVNDRTLLNLYFGKTNANSNVGKFLGVTVKSNQVHVLDNLALIKVEKPIAFSETIGPVTLSKLSVENLSNRFAVMPGFNEGKLSSLSSGNLKYGMFMIQEVAECRRSAGRIQFKNDKQLCTKGWGGNMNSPCDSDMGSGLIVGWPERSEIVGVFLESKCDESSPGVYIHLGKYLKWIEKTIKK